MAGNRHRKDAWVVFALLIVVQIVCFRGSQRLQASLATHEVNAHAQFKRDELAPFERYKHEPPPCQPIPIDRSPKHVCSHVIDNCAASGHIDYLRFYYCAGVGTDELAHDPPSQPPTRPRWRPHISALRFIRLVSILVWMLFLFSWVGVVASDYFCPNLSTIASRLGLNESTAGVTFLAFGNGSPDVFSTFGAMKTDSGSLAIGELLGAASFIVSVISGSMMLIAPFRVKPWPFCRDVGFFTIAVAMTLMFLFDGKLKRIETIALICLYLLYAATVIIGSWWQERQRRRKRRLAAARDEFDSQADNRSLLSHSTLPSGQDLEQSRLLPPPSMSTSQRLPSPSEYDPDFDPFEDWANQRASHSGASTPDASRQGSRAPSIHTLASVGSRAGLKAPLSARPNLVPRHSLLSAIEFRDVVLSLRREAIADRSQEIFQSWEPERFLPPHHHHTRNHSYLSRSTSGKGRAQESPVRRHRAGHNRVTSLGPAVGPSAGLARRASTSSGNRRNMFDTQDGGNCPQLDSAGAGASVAAGNLDDPWREHRPGDACEPLASPQRPSESGPQSSPLHESELRKSLPKLQIPQWDTKAARSQQARRYTLSLQRAAAAAEPNHDISGASMIKDHFDTSGVRRRNRRARSAAELLFWKTRVILNALFPSLRHLHAKSWLGVALSIVTSPAILLLNLTLPVVDDQAERAERENDVGEADGIGAVRLEGDEAQLRAENAPGEDLTAEADASSPPSHAHAWTANERAEAMEDAEREANTQRDREIASALRHLPSMGGSPLSLGGSHGEGMFRFPSTPSPMPLDQDAQRFASVSDSDAASLRSNESCEAEDKEMRRSIRRFLILCQCVSAPTFVTWAIVSSSQAPRLGLKVGTAAGGGALAALLSFWAMRRRDAGKARYSDRTLSTLAMIRCSMGFMVSVMWIMSIVDEVVSILQTVGIIVGLSDAILGLTVFAVGNSLGDLVANITIARLGHPVMAISACFAGPMLNLLLGIGVSGTWLLSGSHGQGGWQHSGADGVYPIDFNPTLLVSGLGLLLVLTGTLIAVPLNNFELTRPIGLSLIAAYVLIMTVNLLTEIFWVRGHTVF